MHIKIDNNLKVVTIRILTFLSGCILALLKAICSPLKEDSCCKHKRLVTGNEATVQLVETDCKFDVLAT